MIWLLPRSDPGATDTYPRPGRCGVSAPAGRLPHGPLPRLFMLWLYAACARGEEGDLERQYSLGDYLLALEFELQAMPALAEQTERLFACRFRAGEEVIPVTRAPTSRPPPAGDRAASHRAARSERGAGEPAPPVPVPARGAARALADQPLSWPAPDELRAFERGLAKVRGELRRLWNEAHPPEDFDDDIPSERSAGDATRVAHVHPGGAAPHPRPERTQRPGAAPARPRRAPTRESKEPRR